MLRSHSFLRVLLAVTSLVLVAGLAMAADEAEKPKALDGKELFKTSCKVCHAAKAAAGEYTPMTLIQEQWDEFFDGAYADTHAKVATPEAADKMVTDVITPEMLEAIRKFCVDHAADSEQPMTCG
jgi:mono/diheme cytochrome c family protein